jgi:hypothetical protein
MYSLLREIANLTNGYNKYPNNKNANQKKAIHELFLEDEEEFQVLNIICHTRDTAPTNT